MPASTEEKNLVMLPQRGECHTVNNKTICECRLGYTGDLCNETVNEALSTPLTLGVLGFIVAFIILAFVLAFIRQRKKKQIRKETAEAQEALKKNGEYL